MSSSSPSRAIKSTDPTSVPTTSGTTKTKKSKSAYNHGFEQHLTDHGIYASHKSREPDDWEDIKVALAAPQIRLNLQEGADRRRESLLNGRRNRRREFPRYSPSKGHRRTALPRLPQSPSVPPGIPTSLGILNSSSHLARAA